MRKLPKLPVVRDTYCSLAMTDEIVDYISQHHLDRLYAVIDDELPVRNAIHYNAYNNLLGAFRGDENKTMDVPETDLGWIDLVYEISRRVRRAYGMEEILIQGKPLAPSPDGPFKDLIKRPIGKFTEKAGLDQITVDKILNEQYKKYGRSCYEIAEMMRRDHIIYSIGREINTSFRELPATTKEDPYRQIKMELSGCLMDMCEIPRRKW